MIYPDYSIEEEVKAEGAKYIVGIDGAGRGALMGKVVAAAVHVSEEVVGELVGKVNDSKKLSPARREKLFDVFDPRQRTQTFHGGV